MAEEVKERVMTDGEYDKILTRASLVCTGLVALFWWVWSWFASVPVYYHDASKLVINLNGRSRWWDVLIVFVLISIFGWLVRLLYVTGTRSFSNTKEYVVANILFTWPCIVVAFSAIGLALFLFSHSGPLFGTIVGAYFGVFCGTLVVGILFSIGLTYGAFKELCGLGVVLFRGLWNWLKKVETGN